MDDAVRPCQIAFDRLLCESFRLWSSYLDAAETTSLLPFECIDLKRLLKRTPSFLGGELVPDAAQVSFSCEEKEFKQGDYALLARGRSMWSTSKGRCSLEPKAMLLDLLLGVQTPLAVHVSDCAPLAEWPGVQGISYHDEGNYLTVLFLAWAYILSARWAELLKKSPDHLCRIRVTGDTYPSAAPNQHCDVEMNLGADTNDDEASWWKAILSPGPGCEISTVFNQRTYLSPWSVLIPNGVRIAVAGDPSVASHDPPSSTTALTYLSRFCNHHRLYGQCSAALSAALYIPFLSGSSISLPTPKPIPRPHPATNNVDTLQPSTLVAEHSRFLGQYMTLSSNGWGLRSVLCGTFFNADIECNLVSAWLNPAFAVLDPLIEEDKVPMLTKILTSRQPNLGSLWLGAMLAGIAKSTLRDIRTGLTAIDLTAAAWTGTDQSFITLEPGVTGGETIRREDECRLLFITSTDGYSRVPICPWKPFGETRLCDAETTVQQHSCCGCHCLTYISWKWSLTSGDDIDDPGTGVIANGRNQTGDNNGERCIKTPTNHELFSQSLSETATRGIFSWLRSTGYPANEKPIYQHSWIDLESSDEEEMDDIDSDTAEGPDYKHSVDEWLGKVQ
ncbi:hypothetical protein Aspvir_008977 [Aspergillus viridinutans]|uniref:Uncharacterized protein n=1 Tax=Aspergillus viridinutans TaxID=75553 RepID=A0A9P3BZ62_ASPVI|nr:uncharacterized protein Aspvir_008977 [Aspergillus viridinutans]GIK04879.1 hypothetical protein Aspvir_008977 [Aspergillus viridinutans]